MSYQTRSNFADSLVAVEMETGGTSLTITTNDGAKFPSTGNFPVIIFGASYASPGLDADVEIALCTARSGDTLTITRAQEGTSAKTWPVGSKIIHGPTAATFTELQTSALFEVDINGNMMPVTDTGARDQYYESDENGDIQPKSA